MISRLLSRLGVLACWSVGIAAWLWCAGALWRHPWWSAGPGAALAIAFLAGTIVAVVRWTWRLTRGWIAVACGLVVLLELLPRPTHEVEWAASHARLPRIEFGDADRVTIRGLRRTTYDENAVPRVTYYDDSFDVGEIESVWFGVQHFSSWRSLAHTFVTFGFRDGRYLAVSVESRRREGQEFSPIAGMYRNYGLIYVLGDEREVIGTRAVLGGDPIYLYPMRADRAGARAMLVDVLERAGGLERRPEFYDTWENNCTNNLVAHLNRVGPIHIRPWSWRIALPGHAGRVAYEHGLIDSDERFDEVRNRAFVNERARAAARSTSTTSAEFSRAIRGGFAE